MNIFEIYVETPFSDQTLPASCTPLNLPLSDYCSNSDTSIRLFNKIQYHGMERSRVQCRDITVAEARSEANRIEPPSALPSRDVLKLFSSKIDS